MAVLKFSRNRGDQSVEQLVAAQQVDIGELKNIKRLQTIKQRTTADTPRAWDWYDSIPELHYGVDHSARVAGHAEIIPKRLVNGQYTGDVKSRQLMSLYEEIWSPHGGQRGFIEQFFRLMKIKAHAHLIRLDEDMGGYDWVSDDELTYEDGKIKRFTLPVTASMSTEEKDSYAEIIPRERYLGRVWKPHPRYLELPDSPMKALDTVCEELVILTKSVRARLMSRLAMAGILFVPSEMSDVVGAPKGQDGAFSNDRVINAIVSIMMRNMTNHDDAIATMPIILRGPGNISEALRFITTDREIYDMDMQLRGEAAQRMLQGLDIQPSVVSGNGDSNHWAAWADRDEELRSQIVPDLEMLCFAIQVLLIQPLALERNVRESLFDTHRTMFDLSGAAARPNLAEDARAGYDRFAVSDAGVRKMSGIPDEFKPDDQEYIRMVGLKIGDPYLATFGLAEAENLDWEKIIVKQEPGPDATRPDGKPKVGPGDGRTPGAPGNSDSDAPKSRRPAA
jgi:hypothetical protein